MNILLIVRSEIISLFVLAFLIVYDRICAKYREGKDYFFPFALTGFGHCLFALITEITVNTPDFSILWNNIFHILFFAFSLLFSLEYFKYVLSLVMLKEEARVYLYIAYILSGICIIIMLFSKIDYIQGRGTVYSAGTGPTVCYTLGLILIVLSDVLVISWRKRISSHIVLLVVPISITTLSFLAIQILIPEFLFSGCALSFTVVGIFFAIENPVGHLIDKAFIDSVTGVWNRSCFVNDVVRGTYNAKNGEDITTVILDINELKSVNDNYGHETGDKLIMSCVEAIKRNLKSAYKIYRLGGDEFEVVYINIPTVVIEDEIGALKEYCKEKSKDSEYRTAMAVGYAELKEGEDISTANKRADEFMYDDKALYYSEHGIERRRV